MALRFASAAAVAGCGRGDAGHDPHETRTTVATAVRAKRPVAATCVAPPACRREEHLERLTLLPPYRGDARSSRFT
jgi:hypothetical protein